VRSGHEDAKTVVTARFRRPAVRSLTTAGGCHIAEAAVWSQLGGSRGKTAAAYMLIAPSLAREPERRRWIIEPNDDGLEIPPWPPPFERPEHDYGMFFSSLFWILLTVLAMVWALIVVLALARLS
jgi:hypothetical protein